jgi:hypothetical protein
VRQTGSLPGDLELQQCVTVDEGRALPSGRFGRERSTRAKSLVFKNGRDNLREREQVMARDRLRTLRARRRERIPRRKADESQLATRGDPQSQHQVPFRHPSSVYFHRSVEG